jgi:RND family efflux transporter MFP subunit
MLNQHAGAGEAEALGSPEPVAARLRTFQITDSERRGGRGRRRGRRWLWVGILAALAAGGGAAWWRLAPGNVPEVETYTFTGQAPRDVLLDLSGTVVPRTRIVISTQVGGIVSKVHLPAEGEKVKAGALLFEVEDTRYRAEYLQAEAGLATAKAQLSELEHGARPEEVEQADASLEQARALVVLTKAEWQRGRKMWASRAAAPADLDKVYKAYVEAQMSLKSQQANHALVLKGPRQEKIAAARAEMQRAQATRDRAKYYYDQTKIYAPAAGTAKSFTLLERKVAAGESIQADLAYTPLCTLADLTQMEAEVDVQERDLGALKIDGPCEVIPDAYPDRTYRARVHHKQPVVNRQRGVVQVKITIEGPDEYLLPDMNARVLLLRDSAGSSGGLPEVPQRALVPGSDPPAVFVFDGRLARLRPIKVGATAGDRVQVREGLRPQDKVILPGDGPLTDGQPVRARGENRAGRPGRKERS